MHKHRPLAPFTPFTPSAALPTPLEPDSEVAFALLLYRASRWPDLKARYHCRFEYDPERLREPPDSRVCHGED